MKVVEVAALGELGIVLEKVHQADGVVGGLSLAVRGDAEDDQGILWDRVEVLKVEPVRRISSRPCKKGAAATHSSGSQTSDECP